MTNGIGTTSAGLTVSLVKDSGDWMLEVIDIYVYMLYTYKGRSVGFS